MSGTLVVIKPKGTRVEKEAGMRLHDYLDRQAAELPDYDFAVQGQRRMSYREAQAEANRLANALLGSGLRPGDRIAYLSKNSIEFALMYYGASKAGVVPVPLNYRLSPPEWAYIINDAEAKLLIAGGELAAACQPVCPQLKFVKRCIVVGAPVEGWQDYQEWVGAFPTTAPDSSVNEDDDVYQMYTSGTTGHPKGAVLTHKAVSANVRQVEGALTLGPGDRYLIVAPIYHAAAAISLFEVVHKGGCCFIQEDFIPPEVVRALSEEKIAGALLVPAMIQACLVMVPDVAQRQYNDLKYIVYGASPIAEQTLRAAMQAFKCDFLQGYGMTELTAVTSFLMPDDHRAALADKPQLLVSAGRPLPDTEVRVVDENDSDVPTGQIGEIIVRGPQVMRGYWNLPEATTEALKGGWMHTGDAGVLDEEGYIYIQDRVKDMIVSGAENVYPRVVEEVLFQHSAIADAAVIGVPDQTWGETVKAILVLKPGTAASADEIMEFCRDKLGGFERPRSVDFVEALPRNASGKVLKRELREPYWQGQTRRVAGS
jgi:acyl-CoA synthetase (AMP-forming)/AMP-acid ligase II